MVANRPVNCGIALAFDRPSGAIALASSDNLVEERPLGHRIGVIIPPTSGTRRPGSRLLASCSLSRRKPPVPLKLAALFSTQNRLRSFVVFVSGSGDRPMRSRVQKVALAAT